MITSPSSLAATDARVREMEEHLAEIYSRAGEEMRKKSRKYFAQFEAADERKRKDVESGKITEAEYKAWRKNKLLYGKRFADFQRTATHELAVVNETAITYINGEIPEVFAHNYNDMGTDITDAVNEQFQTGISFDLVDADTVRLLVSEDHEFLPPRELDEAKDVRWNKKNMQSELLQGILQGESIPTIAARMQHVTDMNRDSAVRNARTMVTGAQNRGRMESMRRAEGMGIILKRIWMSAEDGRVRAAHAELDGQTRGMDEPFHNAIGKIMYPGDPAAAPANVYNCRCTLGTEIIGFIDPVTGKVNRVKK